MITKFRKVEHVDIYWIDCNRDHHKVAKLTLRDDGLDLVLSHYPNLDRLIPLGFDFGWSFPDLQKTYTENIWAFFCRYTISPQRGDIDGFLEHWGISKSAVDTTPKGKQWTPKTLLDLLAHTGGRLPGSRIYFKGFYL